MNRLNVLLIESDLNNTLLENSLNNYGFKLLKIIESGPALLTLIKEIKPDILIFNLDSPSKKLLTDLHNLHQYYPLPVIMFASDGTIDTINQVMKSALI
jgi:response regulator NasT